ncbi:heme-binding domain-containing protein [Niabella yanshanensis]|uniref:Heme-binding domain-containing protein n=1 Tax=Niabella yanshanensis TaxID=577386 RepID=A0ABZ0WCU0_9BACT|nr:heme-binding domain-containing protein [Niabella yanshanensis]WQD40380.1 heme-binding domain-containing protein [Niabella yanshanensis]
MAHVKKKRILIVALAIVTIFCALQILSSSLEKKPVTRQIDAPQEVIAILENSCFNCHSNQQKLSWYDKLAPVSWLVNKDVMRAREVLNFSEWDFSAGEHLGKMYAILNMMQSGKMPLSNYTLLHPAAKITPNEIDIIKSYTRSLAQQEAKTAVPDIAPVKALSEVSIPATLPVSPNGVQYTNEFKKWKVISMSTLFDHTIRVIYGNDIAVKAIEAEDFHPWPDGSIVVKSVWKQGVIGNGEIRPGAFVNAQFMVKDAKKYTTTEGWGFAKFSGSDLHPTGKNAYFAEKSCISCHRQLAEKTGYLFDVPMKVNTAISIKNLQK